MKKRNFIGQLLFLIFLFASPFVSAQTSEFTYQGKLAANNALPMANYDFEFRLYDAASGGTLIGTQQLSGVPVSSGIFTVRLDFGASAFSGASRFLEIALKTAGNAGGYQQLLPRQPITSTPQAIRSLSASNADSAVNANQLGGIPASGFIRNNNSPQTADFSISGSGRANVFDAASAYYIGGNRVLTTGGNSNSNLFAGIGAGNANTTGYLNSFFGAQAGHLNTSGQSNSFFGSFAGYANTSGINNSFFGQETGRSNTTGLNNSFFGSYSGFLNTGSYNSFFGVLAGENNTTGGENSFFGFETGQQNTTGSRNSYFGIETGFSNNTGNDNSFFGYKAGLDTRSSSTRSLEAKRAQQTRPAFKILFLDAEPG